MTDPESMSSQLEGSSERSSLTMPSDLSCMTIQAPGDDSCFFWAVTLAYLIPVRNNVNEFFKRHINLFGDDVSAEKTSDFLQNYNPLKDYVIESPLLQELVSRVFRNRVKDYVDKNREFIQLASNQDQNKYVEEKRVPIMDHDSWAGEPEVRAIMQKFNIDINIIGGADFNLDRSLVGKDYQGDMGVVTVSLSYENHSHYNYYLGQNIINDYNNVIVKDLENSYKTEPAVYAENDYETKPESVGKDLYEVDKTLTKQDIVNLAEIEYGWIVNEDKVILYVVDKLSEALNRFGSNQLSEIRNDLGKSLIYIINIGSDHWVTLGFAYHDTHYIAYYVDPLGEKVPNKLEDHLKNSGIPCASIEIKQTNSDTGIFALKNAKIISDRSNCFLEGEIALQLGRQSVPTMKSLGDVKNDPKNKCRYKEVTLTALQRELLSLLGSSLSEFTYVITENKTSNNWATLTVGSRNGQTVACFVAVKSDVTNHVRDLLSKNDIPIVFLSDDVDEHKLKKYDKGNAEYFIWHTAKIITDFFANKNEYLSLFLHLPCSKGELVDLQRFGSGKQTVDNDEIETIRNRLRARKKLEDKIIACTEVIRKYRSKDTKEFTPLQANIIVLFLESAGFEDLEISVHLDEALKKIRDRVIGDEAFKIIDLIRSKHLIHRKNVGKNNNNKSDDDLLFAINSEDLQKFVVKDDTKKSDFFQKLEKYLNQVIDKLHHKNIHRTNEIQVYDFFKGINEIRKISFAKLPDVNTWLSGKFKNLIKPKQSSSYTQQQQVMFDLIVNIIPLLEVLYFKGIKNKHTTLKELQNIKAKKDEFLHGFHTFHNEIARISELKKFIHTMKPTFFKYICSHNVFKTLQDLVPKNKLGSIQKWLKKSLDGFSEYVVAEFGDQNSQLVSFESISASLNPPDENGENDLENFIKSYVKIMYFIDNEAAIGRRNEKRSLSTKGFELSGNQRKDIYESFCLLKKLEVDEQDEYNSLKEKSIRQVRKYRVFKPISDSIISSYVEGSFKVERGDIMEIENIIYEDIRILSTIFKRYRLSFDKMIDHYRNRRGFVVSKKQLLKAQFQSIPERGIRRVGGINGADVNIERFIVNILEMFQAMTSPHNRMFSTEEEIFSDETFITYLTKNNIKFPCEVWRKLVQIDYISPYIVELIVKDKLEDPSGLINQGLIELDLIIENLLKNEVYATHIRKLFQLNSKKLSKILNTPKKEVILKLSTVLCDKLNPTNIKRVHQLLQDQAYAPTIMHEMSKSSNSEVGKINLMKATLNLLGEVSTESGGVEDFENLLKILNSKGVNALISKLRQGDESDLCILKIQRRIAILKRKIIEFSPQSCAKNKGDKEYDDVLKIFQEIKHKISSNAVEDKFPFSLLILNDIAYTKSIKGKLLQRHSENSQAYRQHEQAYNEYVILCEKVVKCSLGNSCAFDFDNFRNIYNKIVGSNTYENIVKYKYLNILRTASDAAHEKWNIAFIKEKTAPIEALSSYEEACKIYKQIYNIRCYVEPTRKSIGKTMRDIGFVKCRLGKLNSQSKDQSSLKVAILCYQEAFVFYTRARNVQESITWSTHPGVKELDRNRVQILNYVANLELKLGISMGWTDPEVTLEHYNKALELYRTVFNIFKSYLSEKHEHNLSAINNIAFTNNKIAEIKASMNPEKALSYRMVALALYLCLHELYGEVNLSEKHDYNLSTINNIAFTNKKIAELKASPPSEIALQYYNSALKWYQDFYRLRKEVYGESDPRTLNSKKEIETVESRISSLSILIARSRFSCE